MVMKLVLLCFAAFLACVSCRYDPYADLYTTQKPLSQDIVGRYKLVRQTVTRDGLPALGERRPTVELLADGKFIAINLPPPAAPVRDASFFGRLLSASGNWRIDSVGGVDNGIGRELLTGAFIWRRLTPILSLRASWVPSRLTG